VAKEKEATRYVDKTSGVLCPVVLPCQYKVARWVEGAPITISFYLKTRKAKLTSTPKKKKKDSPCLHYSRKLHAVTEDLTFQYLVMLYY